MGKIFGIVHMDIKAGQEAAFREAAVQTIEAAKADLTGTVAYEWFLAEDGRSCTVLEIYDDMAAIAIHSRLVGKMLAPVKEAAVFSLEFAGDPPPDFVEGIRQRLGAAEVFGPLFQGRLQAPAAGIVGPHAGTMIFAVARFAIHPGKEAEFRDVAQQCFAAVEAREPGTLGYEWFLSPDGSKCLTIDVYRDQEALATHMANAGPIMARILPLIDSDTRVYGAVSEESRANFKPGLAVQYVAPQIGGVM
jgi:quinol monooxygenase YgiN